MPGILLIMYIRVYVCVARKIAELQRFAGHMSIQKSMHMCLVIFDDKYIRQEEEDRIAGNSIWCVTYSLCNTSVDFDSSGGMSSNNSGMRA